MNLRERLLAAIEWQEANAEKWSSSFQRLTMTHYRKVVERHQPTTAAGYGWFCAGCSIVDQDENVVALVPLAQCRELPDLAEALGIDAS